MRAKFHWSVLQFTQYETVSILVPAVAGSGGMLFLWSLRQVSVVHISSSKLVYIKVPHLFTPITVQQIFAAVAGANLAVESCCEQFDEGIRLCGLANLSGYRFGCMQISGESHVSHHDHQSVARRGEG